VILVRSYRGFFSEVSVGLMASMEASSARRGFCGFRGDDGQVSTMRSSILTSFTDKDDYGIGIEAVGAQRLNAMVDLDSINIKVNEWAGGVAVRGSREWWQEYGREHDLRPDAPNQGDLTTKASAACSLPC
jgi:hypothetical protein